MIVAVEDPISEAVARKIVQVARPDLTIYQVMRKNGHGYVRMKIRELNRTAQKIPVFVLLDLDRPEPCPADLIRQVLPVPHAAKLLFRIAVLEIESWVMADREAFARFVGVARDLVPDNPDDISDPKAAVVSLAKRSKRKEIRDDLVPNPGDIRKVGPAFNPRMVAFVENEWRVHLARTTSPSLDKAVERLEVAF
jgi:hypothetical protein